MNWLLIIVLIILASCVAIGYRRGFLRIVYSLIGWALVFVFVIWTTPLINNFLVNNTSVYEKVEAYCEETIRERAEEKVNESADETVDSALSGTDGTKTELADLGINLPNSVIDDIAKKTAGMANDMIEASGIYDAAAKGMANFMMQGISFALALIVALVAMQVLSNILGLVSKIPIIGGVNRYCGLFAGAVYGMTIVWVAFYIIAICSSSEIGRTLLSYIYESRFLTLLYENNLVLTLILKFL